MFKQLVTLTRGRMTDRSQSYLDANAMTLLRQQMRDAALGVEKYRKSVAVVMAYAQQENATLKRINEQITDLEKSALDALAQEREEMAIEAADAIAQLETERDTTQKAIANYETQISRLKTSLKRSETQLREMKQGQHLAEAKNKAHRLNGNTPSSTFNDLTDAATTLDRLQQQQDHTDATAEAMVELSIDDNADDVITRLAEKGCGTPIKPTGASVLEKLKKKAAK
ncbi:putative negative regulator protein PspA (suppresses sigma54-dependent transcription) [Rhodobacterales bacterium HTCC2150]|nr:putative negative regulator protein PspA (suppresses sigma54-dependent transcription) [Rhodobacterales bacterium HTCC2150] [Rhodobacteraceae bacterium HTCC2150]